MAGIDSLITIDLAFSQAVIIWEFNNAPEAIQRLAAPFGYPHSEFDQDWIVFVPSDVDYRPFLKLGLSQAVFMYDGQGDSKIIVYKEYL
jgi:hypothetical protein